MASFILGNDPIATGEVVRPYPGRAHATLLLGVPHGEHSVTEGARAPLRLFHDDVELVLHGTPVQIMRTPEGWPLVRWVAGAGTLHRVLRPRYYQGVPARLVAEDALKEVGEQPGTLDLPSTLRVWVRHAESAYRLLWRLAEREGRAIYVGEDGKVHAERPEWPKGPEVPGAKALGPGAYLAPLDLSLRPGAEATLWLGGVRVPVRVNRIVYRLEKATMEVWRA